MPTGSRSLWGARPYAGGAANGPRVWDHWEAAGLVGMRVKDGGEQDQQSWGGRTDKEHRWLGWEAESCKKHRFGGAREEV